MTATLFSRWTLVLVVLSSSIALAHGASPELRAGGGADAFVRVCATRLDLTEEQRTNLRAYLEQEIDYMAVQAANHSPAEVAALVPAEREQLQRVAGHLLSPGQLRQFRELEATPKMQAYLHQMALAE